LTMCVGMSAALVYPKSGFVYAGAVCQSSGSKLRKFID